MNWVDLLIIYLACGTPFAIYRIALSDHGGRATAMRSSSAGLLWPLVGAKAVLRRINRDWSSLSHPDPVEIRSEMEAFVCSTLPNVRPLIFREVFDRYVSLAHASASRTRPASARLGEISGVRSSPGAAECLKRLNIGKLDRHLGAARSEMLEYIVSSGSERAVELFIALARAVEDTSVRAELAADSRVARLNVTLPRLSGSAS